MSDFIIKKKLSLRGLKLPLGTVAQQNKPFHGTSTEFYLTELFLKYSEICVYRYICQIVLNFFTMKLCESVQFQSVSFQFSGM